MYKLLADVLENPWEAFNSLEGKITKEEEQQKCMQIIKEFHFYYSKESDSEKLSQAHFNMHSKKSDIISIKKMFCFDKLQQDSIVN
jgi:hypothetical protein